MKCRIIACVAAMLLAFAGPALAAACDSLSALAWLLGEWSGDGVKSSVQESWQALTPATWAGRGIEVPKSGEAPRAEDLRLVQMGDGVFYIAKVSHNALPVAFRLTECEGGRYVFENPAHDFPRRIEYRPGADSALTVEVSDGAGKGFTLAFTQEAAAGGDEAAVLRAEDARFAAMVAGDTEAMRRTFAEDLAYVHSTGTVQGRDALIAAISGGQLRYLALEPAERKVLFLGPDAAYVVGEGHIHAQSSGHEVDFQGRYLAIYGRIGGNWQLRAWQSLRLP